MGEHSSEFSKKAVMALALAAGVFFGALYFLIVPADYFPSAKIFEINEGEDLGVIAKKLYERGYIRSRSLFRFAVIAAGNSKNLKFGDYLFENPLSLVEVARRIGRGMFGMESVKVTIPEGMNLWEVASLFEDLDLFTAEEFWQITGQPGVDYGALERTPVLRDFSGESDLLSQKPRLVSLEGYLFPDTYFFLKSDSPEEIALKMLYNLERRIAPPIREEIQRQEKTIHEVLTMASILEEEAHRQEDRKIIAGILWKRLKANMPLQVDATLTYVTGKASLNLTNTDLRKNSPYNTYRHKGLPFGPISNPGLESITAALYPEDSPYWFYLSDRSGSIYYSKTNREHEEKKREYLRS